MNQVKNAIGTQCNCFHDENLIFVPFAMKIFGTHTVKSAICTNTKRTSNIYQFRLDIPRMN